MTVRTRQRPRRTPSPRPHGGRGAKPPVGGDPPTSAPASAAAPNARERNAGGPEDRALYHCQCGYVFEASVSASVGCPNCGGAQAW
jgi:hypothetical protein